MVSSPLFTRGLIRRVVYNNIYFIRTDGFGTPDFKGTKISSQIGLK
jgi:hypothetical protein